MDLIVYIIYKNLIIYYKDGPTILVLPHKNHKINTSSVGLIKPPHTYIIGCLLNFLHHIIYFAY